MAAIIGVAGWAATGQMRSVLVSHAHLSQSALPTLAISQQIERSLNGVFLSIEQLNQLDTSVSPDTLGKDITTKIDKTFELLENLKTMEIALPLAARLEGRLHMARRASDGMMGPTGSRRVVWRRVASKSTPNDDRRGRRRAPGAASSPA